MGTLWLAPTVGPVKRVVTKNAKTKTCLLSLHNKSETGSPASFPTKDYFPIDPGTTRTYIDKDTTIKTTRMDPPETARRLSENGFVGRLCEHFEDKAERTKTPEA